MAEEDYLPSFDASEVYGKERVQFENIIWLQIDRINRLQSETPKEGQIKQFNQAVEILDIMCEPLKDEEYEEHIKKIIVEWETTDDELREKVRQSEHPFERHKHAIRHQYAYMQHNKKIFRHLLKLLNRRGRLFKNVGEGTV